MHAADCLAAPHAVSLLLWVLDITDRSCGYWFYIVGGLAYRVQPAANTNVNVEMLAGAMEKGKSRTPIPSPHAGLARGVVTDAGIIVELRFFGEVIVGLVAHLVVSGGCAAVYRYGVHAAPAQWGWRILLYSCTTYVGIHMKKQPCLHCVQRLGPGPEDREGEARSGICEGAQRHLRMRLGCEARGCGGEYTCVDWLRPSVYCVSLDGLAAAV